MNVRIRIVKSGLSREKPPIESGQTNPAAFITPNAYYVLPPPALKNDISSDFMGNV